MKRARRDGNVRKLRTEVDKELAREKRGRVLRGLLGLLVAALVLPAVGYFGYRLTQERYFEGNPRYQLRHVEIEVTGRLPREQVLAWSGVVEGKNLYEIDVRTVQARLQAQPVIASASVRRVIPDTLAIRVVARTPVARLAGPELDGAMLAVDSDGYVMDLDPADTAVRLPELRGLRRAEAVPGRSLARDSARAALALLRAAAESPTRFDAEIVSVEVDRPGMLEAVTEAGSRVRFSTREEEHAEQMRRFERIMAWCAQEERRLASADFTVARNVPVSLLPEPGALPAGAAEPAVVPVAAESGNSAPVRAAQPRAVPMHEGRTIPKAVPVAPRKSGSHRG
jgi:cell division septal protein FtsQ